MIFAGVLYFHTFEYKIAVTTGCWKRFPSILHCSPTLSIDPPLSLGGLGGRVEALWIWGVRILGV